MREQVERKLQDEAPKDRERYRALEFFGWGESKGGSKKNFSWGCKLVVLKLFTN